MDLFLVLGQVPGTNYILSFNDIVLGSLTLALLWLLTHLLRGMAADTRKMADKTEPPTETVSGNARAIVYSELHEKMAKSLGNITVTPHF